MRNLFLVTLVFVAACGEPGADSESGTVADSVPAAGTDIIQGTPDGGVLEWAADIRAGLAPVPGLTVGDPSAAQSQVLDLYVTRQEYLEMYYGPGGRLEATPELADAIAANEARFHGLMQELSKEAPDSARVEALTDSLTAQVSRVEAEAEAAGRELTPWPGAGS